MLVERLRLPGSDKLLLFIDPYRVCIYYGTAGHTLTAVPYLVTLLGKPMANLDRRGERGRGRGRRRCAEHSITEYRQAQPSV